MLLAAGLAASTAYLFFPSLRMWVHAARLREIPQARWVDAHRYDSAHG